MFLHDDVVACGRADRQTQSCALSDRPRRKERIEKFFANVKGIAATIVAEAKSDFAIHRHSKALAGLHFEANFIIF